MKTGILLLAAGRAERFGADKRFARMSDGRSVLDATLANARATGLPLLVCLGDADDQLMERLEGEGTACLCCYRAEEGMGGTLAEGVAHIPGWDAVLVALADMPWVAPGSFRAVAGRLAKNCIVVPVCRGMRGHPVGFGGDFFAPLTTLAADEGARQLLARCRDQVVELPLADDGIHRDIDLPEDLFR